MAKKAARGSEREERREDALSRERIVEAAIELLDADGEEGLTFRALATRLATGPGAIYWHIANKGELLVAATDAVVARTLGDVRASAKPREAIHRVALSMFDAIDARPWVGMQLSRAPWETAMLRIFERIGRAVEALGVRGHAQFTATSTLLSYVIGVSMQNTAASQFARRELAPTTNRKDFLEAAAERWKNLDATEYPFTRKVAEHLPGHDDRKEFLAGIDLILEGIAV
ncbi:TetR/AcrR family transcriptional regulator [Hyalangium versicolor]|uniref:TetR/AcrR family transcriptional regulator n=1 Tax=Hyalangium versicolor TaxID=2861190 RepID=UPI001CCAC155|nr:TetR/AcrR family transcriptional regulator [Hyalangium versicolor]